MKRVIVLAIVAVLLISSVTAIFVTRTVLSANKNQEFYVGVTFCGNTTAEAEKLIDKVADYTNLFVLQSGPLMESSMVVNEIGDYAVAKGLHFAAYFDPSHPAQNALWLANATQRWGNMFAGVYYGDEPGGKMLDTTIDLTDRSTPTVENGTGAIIISYSSQSMLVKLAGGGLQTTYGTFYPNGTISVSKYSGSSPDPSFYQVGNGTGNPAVFEGNRTNTVTTYYTDGTITIEESTNLDTYHSNGHGEIISDSKEISHNFYTMENGTDRIAQMETYQQIQSKNPIPDSNAAADLFVDRNGKPLEDFSSQWQLGNRSFPIFTADYSLYWWDYQSGYDMVLAELGWNNSVTQEIDTVRGAANLQNKSWGTIITWKYMQPPYLPSGDEMFDQMRTSYECGAKYIIVFNYAKDMNGTYGILQDEHFDALQRFWHEVVENPFAGHGNVKAEAAFVLPKNYGWGMRNAQDTVWGLWQPPQQYEQIWPNLQAALERYGQKLDIVYDDPAYPIAGSYAKVIYWNQTG